MAETEENKTADQDNPVSVMSQEDLIRVAQIHAEEPQDVEEEEDEIEAAPIDKGDFEDIDFEETTPEESEDSKPSETPSTKGTDEPKTNAKSVSEVNEKAQEVKKKVASLIKPKWIVKFGDRLIRQGGPYVLKKSATSDWSLDPEDKDLLADLLDVMREEERWDFMPARTWFFIALIVMYLIKGNSVWQMYYTKRAKAINAPQEERERAELRRETEKTDMEEMVKQVEHEEKMAALTKRLEDARRRRRDPEYVPEPTEDMKEAKEILELLEEFPPELFEWQGKALVLNVDGSPRKRRGGDMTGKKRFYSVKKKKFVTKEEYDAEIAAMADAGPNNNTEQEEEPEEIEAEVVD